MVRQLVRQLVYTMFINNNRPSFHIVLLSCLSGGKWFESNWSMFFASQYNIYNRTNKSACNSISESKVLHENELENHQNLWSFQRNNFRYIKNAYLFFGRPNFCQILHLNQRSKSGSKWSTISFIISSDFLMFYEIFLSAQEKRWVIHVWYIQVASRVANDLRFRILGN